MVLIMNTTHNTRTGSRFSDPDNMTNDELGLALYHIGAKTVLSESFTIGFINKVTRRASQMLIEYGRADELARHLRNEADELAAQIREEILPIIEDPLYFHHTEVELGGWEECQITADWSVPVRLIDYLKGDTDESIEARYGSDCTYPDW